MVAVAGVREGDIIAGKYRIENILGVGAMGVVVAARHVKLNERVALKFLLPETLANPEAVARFEREALAAVKIKSEHVARVNDVGTLENGAPYMVMEYLEGGDLAAWIRERGPLSVEQTIEFVLQALEAIAEAHALGIIHRDLKPANLFCIRRADGLLSVKVLDFGISKIGGTAAAGVDLGMTKTADVMGSPLYMSPEQMASARDVDTTTDIWALGIILFQLITGKPPFPAATMPELVLRIATGAPEPLRHVMPDAPEGLERVIFRCLKKDRTKRYRNVAELAWALVEFGPARVRASAERIARIVQTSGQPTSEPVPPPSPAPTQRPRAEETLDAWGKTSPKRAQRKWTIAILSFGLLATAVVSLVHFLSKAPTADAKSTAEPASSPERAAGPPKPEVIETPPPTVSPTHADPVAPPIATAQPGEVAPVPAPDIRKTAPNTPAPTTRRARPATTATAAPRPTTAPSPAPPTALPSRNPYDTRK